MKSNVCKKPRNKPMTSEKKLLKSCYGNRNLYTVPTLLRMRDAFRLNVREKRRMTY